MPQIDLEFVGNFDLFSLMQFLKNFRDISIYVPTQSTTKKRAMQYIFGRERCSFCFKNTLERLQMSQIIEHILVF